MSLAFIGGILIPVLETIRRFHQLAELEYFLSWFDDMFLGTLLLFAAWKTKKNPVTGQLYLCAAWGAATYIMLLSFLGQLSVLHLPDPAPVSSEAVAVIKAGLLLGSALGLTFALKRRSENIN